VVLGGELAVDMIHQSDFLSSDLFLEFSISRIGSESHSPTLTKQFLSHKEVFASSANFPAAK
jgi:hypothetical protein